MLELRLPMPVSPRNVTWLAFLCWWCVGLIRASTNTLVTPRVDVNSKDAQEQLLGYMRSNTPVVLTGTRLGEQMHPDPFDTWFKEKGGHTVVHVPPEYREQYSSQWAWPLNNTLHFQPEAAWGGQPGFFDDEGSMHVDKDCSWFFAAQYGGRKKWTMRQWSAESKGPNGEEVVLGAFFDSPSRFQSEVVPGEVLLWPPWLPHATRIMDPHTFSINGRIDLLPSLLQLHEQGTSAAGRIMERTLGKAFLMQPPPCQGTAAEEGNYRHGEDNEEDEDTHETGHVDL